MEMLAKLAALCCLIALGVLTPNTARAEVYSQGQWTCARGRVGDGSGGWSDWSAPVCWYTPTEQYTPPPIDSDQVFGCRYMRLHRPENCSEPGAMPYQYDYGLYSLYTNGTAMPKLIYLANANFMMGGISDKIKNALHQHTGGLAVLAIPAPTVHQLLLDRMTAICQEQARLAPYGALGTEKCWEATNRLAAEMGDSALQSLFDWVQRQGFDASVGVGVDAKIFNFSVSYSPFDPINSLTAKTHAVAQASQCVVWWEEARAEGCAM